MRVLVCVKQVIDTAARIEIKDQKLDGTGLARVLNPYDEFAIEEALRVRERKADAEVTLMSLGPECFRDSLRAGLAMGADRAVHLMDPLFNEVDSLTKARVLGQAAKRLGFDFIFCGRQAVDDDMAQIGPAIAVCLQIPCITEVTKLEFSENWNMALATRQIEGGSEIIESRLPAVFSCQKGLNQPRLPSLKGIMGAKKKAIEIINANELGFSPQEASSRTTLSHAGLSLPDRRDKGKMIGGPSKDAVTQLVKILREQEKVV